MASVAGIMLLYMYLTCQCDNHVSALARVRNGDCLEYILL